MRLLYGQFRHWYFLLGNKYSAVARSTHNFTVPAAATARHMMTLAMRETGSVIEHIYAFYIAGILHMVDTDNARARGQTYTTWQAVRSGAYRSRKRHVMKTREYANDK